MDAASQETCLPFELMEPFEGKDSACRVVDALTYWRLGLFIIVSMRCFPFAIVGFHRDGVCRHINAVMVMMNDLTWCDREEGPAMARQQTILVVGLVAAEDTSTTCIPYEAFDDFEEQTVYEVVMRLKIGRPLPALLMTTVCTQGELLQLVRAVEGRGIRLAVTTNERTQRQPQSVEELFARLPRNIWEDGMGW